MFHKLMMMFHLNHSRSAQLFMLASLCMATVAISGCSDPNVNRTNFNHIDIGMRYAEVHHMLGAPTWCDDYDRPKECRWGTEERHIYVVFVARRVVDKQSKGL